MGKATEFFEKLQNDPKAKEILAAHAVPDSFEQAIKVYAAIAEKLDFDLTEAEIKDEIAEQEKAQAAMTDQAANAIKELAPDQLDKVAGGYVDHPTQPCKDTFKDKENCWLNDGCDHTYNSYMNYHCKNSNAGACIIASD